MVLGDVGDESLAKTLATILFVDSKKENVAITANRSKADETLVGPICVEIDCRPFVGVFEEVPSLSKNILLLSDAFFESPS